ncbi:MAG: DNA polymerase III subunit chi [Magnetococcales bacterium]|nr:DNA polymerase III subunit chi [Magnetococcales bacterium]
MARRETGAPRARFYQVGATPLPLVLVRIATRVWVQGLRGCVVTGDAQGVRFWDELLWTTPEDAFLPHGPSPGPDLERQPILVAAAADDANAATVAIMAAPILLPEPERFDQVVEFVQGGHPAALYASRDRFRHYRELGCTMEYWVQTASGKWQKK